jgi:ABC-type nitrate/sulfonate/bicarbonate transport system substrate-binding protein
MRVFLALACALVLVAYAGRHAGAQQTPLLKLRLATISSDIGAEVYYAKDMGFFTKAGLDVEITPITNGAAISSAVASGAIDIGYATGTNVALAHEKGLPFTVIAPANLHVGNAPTAGLLAVTRDSFGDPLIGKPEDPLRLLANSFNAVAPNFLPSMWVATIPWVAAHPVETKAFIAAMRETAVWANSHHRPRAI